MAKAKLIAIITTILIILALISGNCLQSYRLKKVETQLENTTINYKALENEAYGLKNENRTYLLTIEDLELTQDSLLNEVNEVRKALKIKDKEIRDLAYLLSTASRVDTLFVRDTIFQEGVKIDTTITDDKWYSLNLGLHYPNEVIVEPQFKSEKNLIFFVRKEVLHPSKCRFVNLFRKKAKVMEVVVEEKNPYITNDKQKFIHIVK